MTYQERITTHPHEIADSLEAWRRAVDVRRFMTSRFVRRGASYGEAIRAAHTLFPLPQRPERDTLASFPGNLPRGGLFDRRGR